MAAFTDGHTPEKYADTEAISAKIPTDITLLQTGSFQILLIIMITGNFSYLHNDRAVRRKRSVA
jgi:hypothetical protein